MGGLKRDALRAVALFIIMALLHELGHFLVYVAIHGIPAWFEFNLATLTITMNYRWVLPWARIWVAAGGLLCGVTIVFVRNVFTLSVWLGMLIYSIWEVVLYA